MKDLVVVTRENVNFLNNKNVNIQLAAGGGKFERKNMWVLLASFYKVMSKDSIQN